MPARKPFPWIAALIAAACACYAVSRFYQALLPFFVSFIIAYALSPLVRACETRGLRRGIAVVVLYAVIGLLLVLVIKGIMRMALNDIGLLRLQLPLYVARSRNYINNLQSQIIRKLPYGSMIVADWDPSSVYPQLFAGSLNVSSYALGIFPILSFLILIPFITFFLLIDGPRIINRLIQACPSSYVEQALHLISAVDASIGNYFQGLLIVASAIAIASAIGLTILGVNQALIIAAIAGLASFIPYFGAIVGAAIGGFAACFQFGTLSAGLKVVLLFLAIKLGDDLILEPIVAKHTVQLHPLILIIVLMVGGEFFGFAGLIFAVPVTCMVKAMVQVLWSWYSTEAHLQAPEVPGMVSIPYT